MANHETGILNATASGNTAIVAAPTDATKKIQVLSAIATTNTAGTIKFQSATTNITPGWPIGVTGGFVLPYNGAGWFETAAGEALNFNQSGTAVTGVMINYRLI